MNLKDKLYQIDSTRNVTKPPPTAPREGKGIEFYVSGENRETPYGNCFIYNELVSDGAVPGKIDIFALPGKSPELFPLVGKESGLEQMDIQRTLFLDTETTGLAGGAGTYVILVGVGYFAEDGFRIEQFFMRDYHEEQALLHCLSERLAEFQSIVTYNGKSYDVPLLKTRFALARMDSANIPEMHLDLLFTARRLWRHLLESFSLASVEAQQLGIQRVQDTPGSQVPQIYFDYLKTGEARLLQGVLEHNRQDILSLAALFTRACEMFEIQPGQPIGLQEYVNIGRVYEDLLLYDRCIPIFKHVHAMTKKPQRREELACRLSLCFKRQANWEAAVSVWQEMLQERVTSLFPFVELAKYFEHVAQDYSQAQVLVQKALHWLEMREFFHAAEDVQEERQELFHRMRRIKQKISKSSGRPLSA